MLRRLEQNKISTHELIRLSEYIIKNKTEYYKKLRNITENNDWEGFILYMLDMIETTAQRSLIRLGNVVSLMEITSKKIKKELPKVYSKDLVEILFKLPYTKRQFLI